MNQVTEGLGPVIAGFADLAQMIDQRVTRRFRMALPVEITQLGGMRVSRRGLTFDISSGGIYFSSNRDFAVGVRVDYLVTLSRTAHVRVQIRCLGQVVKILRISDPGDFTCGIAVSLDRYQFIRSIEPIATSGVATV